MTMFHLFKIRTIIDIFKNEKCKVTFGLEYISLITRKEMRQYESGMPGTNGGDIRIEINGNRAKVFVYFYLKYHVYFDNICRHIKFHINPLHRSNQK